MDHHLYKTMRKQLYKELQPFFERLEMDSVNYAVVKGEALSQQIYGVVDNRKSNDIDILVEKKSIKTIERILDLMGFKQTWGDDATEQRKNRVLCLTYSHQVPSFVKNKNGFILNIDINYDIFWGEYEGARCSIEEYLNDTTKLQIYGANVRILTIEKAFIHLLLHHYKEMNSLYHLTQYNCIRTHMFKDIYDMLKNNRYILTPQKVVELCRLYGVEKYCYYMLFYTTQVFKDEFMNSYMLVLQDFRTTNLLNIYGLSPNEQKVWNIPFESRLDNEKLWEIVINELSEKDKAKMSLNKKLFG